MDEDEEKIAVAATFGISAVFKSPSKQSSSTKAKLLQAAGKASAAAAAAGSPTNSTKPVGSGGGGQSNSAGPSNQNVDKERLTVDISALRQQYSKLRQRQKQAHIIFTCKGPRWSMISHFFH